MNPWIFLVVMVCGLGGASAAVRAQEPRWVQRCQALAEQATVQVRFEDIPVTAIDHRSSQQLTRLSGGGLNAYHSILGVTHAEPSARQEVQVHYVTQPLTEGTTQPVCAVPSLVLTLGFSRLEVSLAHDLTDGCRRALVAEHEQEHVAVWRNHLRIAARLLAPVLRQALAQPQYFHSVAEAQSALPALVDQRVATVLRALQADILTAQQQIDTPASYLYTQSRMRACP